MKELMSELGFKDTKFAPKQLFKKLEILVEIDDEESNRKSVKIFFFIFFHNVVCGSSAAIFARTAIMVKDMDYPEMAKMHFCEVIVECIREGAKTW